MMPPAAPPPLKVAWLIWGLCALFYMIGFFQRVAPAVLTAELMRDFTIGAAALGQLSAFYFYSYVAMQIPTGILADRWGPRRLLSAGALVAGAGTVLFALAPSTLWANAGRLLIGGSVAVALVGLLKLANHWFPPRFFALISGIALFCGLVGAVFAGPPLRLLVNHFSWRSVMLLAALVTLGVGAAIWRFVRDHPHEKGYADLIGPTTAGGRAPRSGIFSDIGNVLAYRNTLLLCGISGGLVGCVLTFGGLWGVPYLTTHYGLPTTQAAGITSALLMAWGVGGPFFGWLSDRLGRRKPLYILGAATALSGWSAVVLIPDIPPAGLIALLLLTGFSSGAIAVSFAFAKESVPAGLAGTVSGVVNMGTMMGPMLLQPAMGWVLDRRWDGTLAAGVRLYNLEAYRYGFSLLIAWAFLALVLLFFTRETRCRQIA
jgi:MFS family permease